MQRLRTGTRLPIYYNYATVKSEQIAIEIYEKCLGGEVPAR